MAFGWSRESNERNTSRIANSNGSQFTITLQNAFVLSICRFSRILANTNIQIQSMCAVVSLWTVKYGASASIHTENTIAGKLTFP